MSKDFDQGFAGADESDVGPPRRGRSPTARERPFKLGPLGTLNQIIVALGKSIRAMADGTLDSQVGARICNGLGIMRACLETQKLEQLERAACCPSARPGYGHARRALVATRPVTQCWAGA